MDIGSNIKRRRMELGISQERLALELGYKSRSTIAKIESGQNDIPLSKLVDLARILDVSIEGLLTGLELPLQDKHPGNRHRARGGRTSVAVILAGGQSTRNLQNIPNQFINVLGKPVMIYCMEAYQKHPLIDDIYVVCQNDWSKVAASYASEYAITKLRGVIRGGASGIRSIHNAVKFLINNGYRDSDIVVFQEATRPFVTEETISKLLATSQKQGSAILCEPMRDNVQFQLQNGKAAYLDRETVVDLQSPDAHTIETLTTLFEKAQQRSLPMTDNCVGMLMAKIGMNPHFCEGGHNNLKIVRQEDIAVFSALLKARTQ